LKFLLNKKIIAFIITLQEAFIALIPFIVFSAFLALLSILISYFHINIIAADTLYHFERTVLSFTSLIAIVSIAFFTAKRIKVSEIIAIILSIVTFVSILVYEHPHSKLILPYGFTAATIFAPIASTYFLKILYPKFSLHINVTDGNYHIYRFFNYIFVFFAAYTAVMTAYIAVDAVMDILIDKYNPLKLNLPDIVILAIRDFFVQLFWFFGIHGEHMVNALFGKEILFRHMFPNLTYGEFHRIFVNIGGAGIGASLLMAILINVKDATIKKVAEIASPFVIFNINDILIFLIVVFNRFLFLPFVLLPLFNLAAAYIFLHTVPVHFTSYRVVWSTPVLLDGFLKSNSFTVPIFQILLLIIDTAVYSYFIKKYFKIRSPENKKQILQSNLGIEKELGAKKDIRAFIANQELIEANAKLNEIINDLNKDNLMIYYQPKIDIKSNRAMKYEALIRYNDNGRIKGPFFLDIIEKAGLAPIIDIWVCKQVKKDIEKWKKENFYPEISVNLHPDTLKSDDAADKIISIFTNENIMFEIIERSFISKEAQKNIQKLKENSFPISIDDFGVGYSSLDTLIRYKIEELKLDKSLVDEIETEKGLVVCKNIVNLCKEIQIKVVAEGVEKKSQLNLLQEMGIDYIQGYIFSPAIPFRKVKEFSENFNLNGF
jgi:EAL domain-containing protein (putative c-di-GMP-specific phosphodiesterase class I)/cellobiose-specific phosphotransferase system component IIC